MIKNGVSGRRRTMPGPDPDRLAIDVGTWQDPPIREALDPMTVPLAIDEGTFLDRPIRGPSGGAQGVATWPDGTRYEGEFRDGLPRGQGVATKPDGTSYFPWLLGWVLPSCADRA